MNKKHIGIAVIGIIVIIGAIVFFTGVGGEINWGLGSSQGGTGSDEVGIDVLKVEERYKDKLDMTPGEGNVFLYIQVEVKNNKEDKNIDVNPNEGFVSYRLETEAGKIYDRYMEEVNAPAELTPGAQDNFWLSFEIPKSETGKTLIFELLGPEDETYTEEVPSGVVEESLMVSISFDNVSEGNTSFTIHHTGGDVIPNPSKDMGIMVAGEKVNLNMSNDFSFGDKITINIQGGELSSGDTIQVIYDPANQTLAETTVPSETSEHTPTISMSVEEDSGTYYLYHNGGDALENDEITITVRGDEIYPGPDDFGGDDTFEVGESFVLDASKNDRIVVVHDPSNSLLLDTEA